MSSLIKKFSKSSVKSNSSNQSSMSSTPAKIAILQYSTYGHIATLAEQVAAGVKESGASVEVFQFQETLNDEILGKMHANKAPIKDLPVITPAKLAEFDGFLLGFPTRYGRAPAQVSAFFDATGGLWASGALVGKFAGIFVSTGTQHGGVETTALTTLPYLVHHGVNFVPIGYQFPELSSNEEIHGSSAYGAGTIAGGDGSRQSTALDLSVAKKQGAAFAKTVSQFVRGAATA